MNCTFCKIIQEDIPSYTIYEDEIVKVFLDIHPHSNGHMLIIPKKHYVDLIDIEDETLTYIYKKIIPKLYKLLQQKMKADGLSVCQNNGTAQDVKHYHVHLIPKYKKAHHKMDIKDVFEKLK